MNEYASKHLSYRIVKCKYFDKFLQKGEHDPLISFKSRVARLIGKWKLIEAEIIYQKYYDSDTYTETYTYDGTTELLKYTDSNGETESQKYTMNWEFKKKGKFIFNCTIDNNESYTFNSQ